MGCPNTIYCRSGQIGECRSSTITVIVQNIVKFIGWTSELAETNKVVYA